MTQILLVLVILLSLGLWFVITALQISLQKNDTYESALNRYYKRLDYTLKYMKVIDDRGIFENDDEVGEGFKQLLFAIQDLQEFVPGDADEIPDE